jgi:DNA-binding XRE family transcriptional regulator
MAVAAKERHIEVYFGKKSPKLFLVPLDKAHSIQKLIEEYRHQSDEDSYISAKDAFAFIEKDIGRPAVLVAGFRHRDSLTQTQLAKKVGTTQSAIAAIESGKRAIGRVLAQKLAKIFDTDYRNFL